MKNELVVLTLLLIPRNLSAQNAAASGTSTNPTPKCPITDCPDQYMPHGMVDPPAETKKAIVGVLKQIPGARKAEKDAKTDLTDAEALYQAAIRESKAPLSERAMKDIKEFAESPKKLQALIDLMESKDPTAAAAANYLQAKEKVEKASEQTRALYQAAIDQTVEAYHLKPPVPDPAQDPAFPQGTRKLAGWSVQYNDREVSEDQKNAQLAQRNAVLAAKGLQVAQAHAAITDPNTGKSYIFREGFEDPDKLAAMILHETRHWVDAVARGGVSTGHGELTAYDSFRTEQNAFNAEADFLGKNLKLNKGAPMLQGAKETAKVYNEQAETLKQNHATGWTKLQLRLDPRYKNFIGIESNAEYGDVLLPSGPARLEPLKDGADHDFIGSYVGDVAPTLAAAKQLEDQIDQHRQAEEAAQRELERQRAEKEDQERRLEEERRQAPLLSAADRQQAAQSCGFEEANRKWGDEARDGFRDNANRTRYYFRGRTPPDDGITKASYLLMRACLQQTQGALMTATANGPVGEPCDDALAIMQSRWSERGFRGSLLLGTDEVWTDERDSTKQPPTACIHYVAAALEAPIDMQRIRNVMQNFRSRAIAAENEYAKRYPSSSHEGPADPGRGNRPTPRNDPKPAPNPFGPHCWPGNEGGMSCVTPVN